jgi:hypothetical protein
VLCQLKVPNKTDLQRYSILSQLLSSNQTLFYKARGSATHARLLRNARIAPPAACCWPVLLCLGFGCLCLVGSPLAWLANRWA